MFSVSIILASVASVASAAIGFIVWKSERTNRYRKSFLLLSFFVCFWVLSNVVFAISEGLVRYSVALSSYAFALLLAVQLCASIILLLNDKVQKKLLISIMLPGILFAFLSAVPGFIARGVTNEGIQTNLIPLSLYGVTLLTYLTSVGVLLVRGRRKYPENRGRINIMLLGVAISGVLGACCNLILPLFGNYNFTLLGPASAVFFIGAIAYAIVRHGLLDVRLAVVRSTAYFLTLTTIVSLYFGIAFVIYGVLGDVFSITISPAFNVTIAILLALLFQPIKRFFDRTTNRIFYRDSYDPATFYARLSNQLRNTSDLRDLLDRAVSEIVRTLKAERGFFYIQVNGRGVVQGLDSQKPNISEDDLTIVDRYLNANKTSILVRNLLEDSDRKLEKIFERLNVEIILSLDIPDSEYNFLFLGPQRSRTYKQRDLQTLRTISSELSIAVQNAIRFEQIRDFNETLQQRIDEATKELRHSNEQLQKLDTAKDEFVSMASHQLRTPLTSVKGYISMVLEGDVGKISPMQRQLLGEAFTSSERMVHLIGDFLNVSRLQTGKFILEKKPVDLAKLTSQEIDSLETTVEAHGLKLSYRKPSYFPILMLDEGKIRQVLMNFIDNAIFYTQEGGKITVKLGVEDGFAVVRVIDAGIGVPKNEQAHLFTKFFRASNARKQRPDGTGVGLFLAKKVITAHGGTMLFESEEGKGSTFGFRLPIKKLQVPSTKK